MNKPAAHNPARGQTSLEYLLLLAVVAVVVIASFKQGSLVSQVHDGAQGYYNTVTRVIMASGTDASPTPINGGWCPVTCPSGSGPTTIYQSCECPAPAFGGTYCAGTGAVACGGSGTVPCGPCPTGQDCNAQGVCVCSDGLDCSSIPNASPDPTCTKCNCNNYTYWDAANKSCDYCTSQGGLCYTSTDGVSCTAVTCPTYAYCDTSTNQCVYCPEGQMYNGSSCVPIVCPPNMYFDTNPSDPGYNTCACIAGYEYTTGPGCVPCPGGVCGPCTPSASCNGFDCGKDSCGNSCGICTGSYTCSSATGPGTCTCTATSCTVTAPCGSPFGIDNCENVCQGSVNNCPPPGEPGETTCDLASLPPKCICGVCQPDYECGNTAGHDACGHTCVAAAGTCPAGNTPPYYCTPSFECTTGCGGCTADFECGSTSGHDDCGVACTAPMGTCTLPATCDPSNECTTGCGTCSPDFECGSTVGHDGCGTPCTATAGTCPTGNTPPYVCNASGECVTSCTPDCTGKVCGNDGCGGSCGSCTAPGMGCDVNSGQCVACTPNCSGKTCGDDGCGGSCGTCTQTGTSCDAAGQCTCSSGTCMIGGACVAESCAGIACGQPDNCGVPCNNGFCSGTGTCVAGTCCAMGTGCGTSVCGTDACGNPNGCGACTGTDVCSAGKCVPNCTPNCAGSTCGGPDGCGGTCSTGTCPSNQTCSAGTCVDCPNCAGATCGASDGCGGICSTGTCLNGGTCSAGGQCETTITLQISDYGNCKSCASVCSDLDLNGSSSLCGTQNDCGASCGIYYGQCSTNPDDFATNCGSCLTETMVGSGQVCLNGIASVVSTTISGQTSGSCGNNPTPGTATITYTVVCNP